MPDIQTPTGRRVVFTGMALAVFSILVYRSFFLTNDILEGEWRQGLLAIVPDPCTNAKPSAQPKINWLSIDLPVPKVKKLRKATDLAAAGKLGDALAFVGRLLQARDPEEAAEGLHAQIEKHIESRRAEAKESLDERRVLHALSILEPLSKALRQFEGGIEAKRRIDMIRGGHDLQRELKAERALAKSWQRAYRSGVHKARSTFENVIKELDGTLAASEAKDVIQ